MQIPVLYVLAGPNGIGKTTTTFDLIPKNIPVINSDEIAKLAKLTGINTTNTQEYSNREAMKIVTNYLEQKISFGIETNLCDKDTWKFLIDVKKNGYSVHILFLSTDNIELLNKRIEERHKRGEHFVYPSIVKERYYNSISLLEHYLNVPDKIQFIDNSDFPKIFAEKINTEIHILLTPLPEWVKKVLQANSNPQNSTDAKALGSTDEVRKLYKRNIANRKGDFSDEDKSL